MATNTREKLPGRHRAWLSAEPGPKRGWLVRLDSQAGPSWPLLAVTEAAVEVQNVLLALQEAIEVADVLVWGAETFEKGSRKTRAGDCKERQDRDSVLEAGRRAIAKRKRCNCKIGDIENTGKHVFLDTW